MLSMVRLQLSYLVSSSFNATCSNNFCCKSKNNMPNRSINLLRQICLLIFFMAILLAITSTLFGPALALKIDILFVIPYKLTLSQTRNIRPF